MDASEEPDDLSPEEKPAAKALHDQIQATLTPRQIESIRTMARCLASSMVSWTSHDTPCRNLAKRAAGSASREFTMTTSCAPTVRRITAAARSQRRAKAPSAIIRATGRPSTASR